MSEIGGKGVNGFGLAWDYWLGVLGEVVNGDKFNWFGVGLLAWSGIEWKMESGKWKIFLLQGSLRSSA